MSKEKWVAIKGYSNRYEISSCGNIRSLIKRGNYNKANQLRDEPHLLHAHKRKDGYLSVALCRQRNKKMKTRAKAYLIHRLVASNFIGRIRRGFEIAHIDGDKANNNVANLKICSHKENEFMKIKHGRTTRGEKNGCAKLTARKILLIKEVAKNNVRHSTIAELCGLTQGHVSRIVNGSCWSHTQ